MSVGKLLRKIFFVDLLVGLSITFKEMLSGAITLQYPRQRPTLYERFRGEPRMAVNEDGSTKCIACMLCAQVCPENCITVLREKDPETKKFKLTGYTFDMHRCMFCGFCEEVCPTDCILLTPDYEMAQFEIKDIVLDWKSLEKGMPKTMYKK